MSPNTRRGVGSKGVTPRLDINPLEVGVLYWDTLDERTTEEWKRVRAILSRMALPHNFLSGLSALEAEFESKLSEANTNNSPFPTTLYQLIGIVGKAPHPDLTADAQSAAEKGWRAAEDLCRRTNAELRANPDTDLVRGMRQRIASVLGELTHSKYKQILRLARPGPGSTIGTRYRKSTAPVFKLLKAYTECCVTREAIPVATDYYLLHPHDIWRELESVEGRRVVRLGEANRVSFVPKNAKTFRAIAKEHSFNVRIQLGVHEWMRGTLARKCGVYLDDQTRNRVLARIGSETGLLATIDLSSASDTVCRELVKAVLHPSWFEFFDMIRAKSSVMGGEEIKLEKFSSMGNGFTFALECLIFWALAQTVIDIFGTDVDRSSVAIYGDDIIFPTHLAPDLISALTRCGFLPNSKKSFWTGSFRESCGGHYFKGRDVKPAFLRSYNVDVLDVYRLHNTVLTPGTTFRTELLHVIKRAHGTVLYGLCNELVDSCAFVPFEKAKKLGALRYNHHLQNYQFRGLMTVGIDGKADEVERYFSALLGDGSASIPVKGLTKTRSVWLTAGKPAPFD